MENLTKKQEAVLSCMRGLVYARLQANRQVSERWYASDIANMRIGDKACVTMLGVLTRQVANALGITPASALYMFKVLENKGLVITESWLKGNSTPRYWLPVGIAQELLEKEQKA